MVTDTLYGAILIFYNPGMQFGGSPACLPVFVSGKNFNLDYIFES